MKKLTKSLLAIVACLSVSSLNAHAFGQPHDHGGESLAFVLPEWKTMHFDDATKAGQHLETVKKMGCEVKQGNHSDIRFRAPTWRDIHVADHASADQWKKWLKQTGFEARHEH